MGSTHGEVPLHAGAAETDTADPGAGAAVPRHRFTVDDFARLGAAGIFAEDDRVELIDGEIRDMTPIGPPHAWIVNRLFRRLVLHLADRAWVSVQNPLRLDRHTEPQPDLVVACGEDAALRAGGHPGGLAGGRHGPHGHRLHEPRRRRLRQRAGLPARGGDRIDRGRRPACRGRQPPLLRAVRAGRARRCRTIRRRTASRRAA